MQQVADKTARALRQHAVIVVLLTLCGTGIALLLWLTGGFVHAEAPGMWGSGALIFVGLLGCAFSCSCLVITDFQYHLLPHRIMVPSAIGLLAVMALNWALGGPARAVLWALGVAVGVTIVLFALALLPGAGLGGGDVKLAGLLAGVVAWLNPPSLPLALLLALASATIYAVALIVMRKGDRHSAIPLGPFLIAGAWSALAMSII